MKWRVSLNQQFFSSERNSKFELNNKIAWKAIMFIKLEIGLVGLFQKINLSEFNEIHWIQRNHSLRTQMHELLIEYLNLMKKTNLKKRYSPVRARM